MFGRSMFAWLRRRHRRRKYYRGARLSRFIAPDVRRDVEIIDDSESADGYVVARIRTWNVLHAARAGDAPLAPFETRGVAIGLLWSARA